MINLKNENSFGDPPKFFSEFISQKIKKNLNNLPFKDIFINQDVDLVPIPKSSLMTKDSLWVPNKIAIALSNQGMGTYFPCLQRIKAVPKSSCVNSKQRPKPIEHFNSVKIKELINQPKCIVLIDDIITRGSTLIECANVLKERYPKIPIYGFAIMRTISNPEEFKSIVDPCRGEININLNEAYRTP
jgi:predicted amidophosphoribosyltransferase